MNINISDSIIKRLFVLMVVVSVSSGAFAFRVAAQNNDKNESLNNSQTQQDDESALFPEFEPSNVVHNQPHGSCWMEAYYNSPRSTTYQAPAEYRLNFVPTENGGPSKAQSFFQDMNGDSLPDYVYAYNYTGAGTSSLSSFHVSCLYLHNGSGWDKVYACYARTETSMSTGQVTTGEYGGDCAG